MKRIKLSVWKYLFWVSTSICSESCEGRSRYKLYWALRVSRLPRFCFAKAWVQYLSQAGNKSWYKKYIEIRCVVRICLVLQSCL